MSEEKFPAFELRQNGKVFYLTYMNAEELVDNTEADVFDARTKLGYQRRINEARARAFKKFMTGDRGVSPTAIILSYRDTKPIFKVLDKTHNFGILTLDKQKFWQVDGQHRIQGLRELVEASRGSPPLEYNRDMMFPVIIICPALWGAEEMDEIKFQEAYQFYVINKTQKSIDTALTEEFLLKLNEKLGGVAGVAREPLPTAMIHNIDWVPTAIELADELNKTSAIWSGKILLANEKPHAGTFVNQKAFTDSLSPVLKSDVMRSMPKEDLLKILEMYWKAIREKCPEAYTNYTKYVLFRRTGVFVMHSILPDVVTLINNYVGPIVNVTEKAFVKVLEVTGMDSSQWEVDSDWGRMGTSHKTIKIIADSIRESLRDNFKR
ncbi:MAG: DGQHR domain-containing protein [Candidatus Micrarchaeaceae archaeon]